MLSSFEYAKSVRVQGERHMELVYIVEDDLSIQEIETIALKNSNYDVEAFTCAADFFAALHERVPQLVLLDIMLPDNDGYAITRTLRSNPQTAHIPIIMLTAKTAEIDMIRGLDNGADDYICKPFSVMELLSRMRAVLRRSQHDDHTHEQYTVGTIKLDHARHSVDVEGKHVVLTLKEYDMLRYLMSHESLVLTREALMQAVWGFDFEGESRTVDMHIKTLRQKLGEASCYIQTIRGVGYCLRKPDSR